MKSHNIVAGKSTTWFVSFCLYK